MLKKYFIMAITAIFALVACSEKFDEPGIQPAGSDNVHTLSVGIEAGTYTPAEGETKASMEAVIRVNWTKDDEVSVVNATTGKILGGCLKAKESGVSVTFEGTVTGTINQNDKLYYIYPKLNNTGETDFAAAGYDVSLAGQTYDGDNPGKVSFFGYAEDVATTATATISKKIQFKLVTSYAHLNMANLPAKGFNLSSIDISKINKGFKWSLSESGVLTADAYGENEGISVNCSNCKITQAGNAVVRFAIPASDATGSEPRVVTVNKAYTNDKYIKDQLIPSAYYNQLYTSWTNENVNVNSAAGDKTEVTIDNLGSTETAEGILPVSGKSSPAFDSNKETEIKLGGLGTITFNKEASAAIRQNTESAQSTNVFFKVEDVTQTKPVQAANLVYEITMKTVDGNGTEVFSKANAGDGSEATVVIELGQSVSSVESVSLVDDNGQPVSGDAVKNVNFDPQTGKLTFTVVHFSKYAIKYETKAEPESGYVAQIGGRKYETLASAIAAAQNGNTIQMIADFATTDKVTVGADKNIILDLNGKTISYTTDGYESFIENRGQLKVKDSGSNGIITAKFNNPNWNAGCYTINNAGTYDKAGKLVIESGTIENTSPDKGLAWPISNGIYGTNADLVINGGTIHSTNYVPVREYLQCGGKKTIVINGGKFISDNSRAIAIQVNDATIQDTDSSVTINGGEFTCNGSGIFYVDLHAANVNMTGFAMTVNGGQFKNSNADAPVLVYDEEGNSQTSAVLLSKILKGGTYSQKPASELLADGYAVKQNTDGSWTVEIENFWPNFAASSFSNINEGEKTITISSPAELALLAKKINGGTSYAGYTISINGSLDMGAHFWIPINARNGQLSGSTVEGTGNAVISNLKIEKAVYSGNYDYYAGFIAQSVGALTIKNLTFSGAVSVDNGSGVATVLGLPYGNTLFDNVKVVNSTVSATTKAGALVGFTGGNNATVTVKDCTLEGVTVKAEYSYALMVGLVNTSDHVVFEGSNTATNSHAVLDETIAANGFPTRKTIKGYEYGVSDNILIVIGVQDAWAEQRTNPLPKLTFDNEEYTLWGDKFYHADGVVVDICAPDPVAKIGNIKYATLDEAFAAVQAGQTIEIIQAGTYKLPASLDNITISSVEGVEFDCEGSGSIASIPNGSTFKNVTMNFGNSGYHGFQHAGHIIMDGCILNGLFFSYGDMTFTKCTFNQTSEEYSMWCYAGNCSYDNCTFNNNGKFLNVYNEGNSTKPWKVSMTNCQLNSSKKNKAVLNIKENCITGAELCFEVNIANCKVNDETKFPEKSGDIDKDKLYVGGPLWQVDDRTESTIARSKNGTGVTVTLNGEIVYGQKVE